MNSVEAFIEAIFENRVPESVQQWDAHRDELKLDFVAAAMAGDLESVQAMLEIDRGLARQTLPPYDRPILCYVCQSRLIEVPRFEQGILDVVRALLKAGADPDSSYSSEWGNEEWKETALYGAAGVVNHAGLTKLLLDAGADPDDGAIQDGIYHGESLYHACDFPGRNECLRLLLEANPSQVAAEYSLNRKLDFEDEEGVRLFLDHGANPNGNKTRSALSHAILRGRSTTILALLLAAGADPNHLELDGTTPYVMARRLADRAASELLESHGARAEFGPYDAVLIAAADEDQAEVERLVSTYPEILQGLSDLGRQEHDGFALGAAGQLLHDMARLGHVKALKALLDLGMDPGARNQYNETPLHWACVAGRAEAAELLLERGAPQDVIERNHNCVPVQWVYWGSEYWNEPHGDYGKTAEVLLNAGSPLPERLEGSEAVKAVLRARGLVD